MNKKEKLLALIGLNGNSIVAQINSLFGQLEDYEWLQNKLTPEHLERLSKIEAELHELVDEICNK